MNTKENQLASEMNASILVVDDELGAVSALEIILRRRGYKIQSAGNGLEALSKLYSEHFDLVITDILMPKFDGIRLSRRIRKEWPTLPILVITAFDDEQTCRELLAIGISGYLMKPFDLKQLIDVVEEALQPFMPQK